MDQARGGALLAEARAEVRDMTRGQINYEAYRLAADGASLVSGDPLPDWVYLGARVQQAWEAGAVAVELAHAQRLGAALTDLAHALEPMARSVVSAVQGLLSAWGGAA